MSEGDRVEVVSQWAVFYGRVGSIVAPHSTFKDHWWVWLDGESAPMLFGQKELRTLAAKVGTVGVEHALDRSGR